MSQHITPIEKVIPHFQKNGFVIVMDDMSRENEGDLITAAANITTEQMAFLIRYSSGYVCAPMSNEYADRLDLPLMRNNLKCVSNADDRHGTAYTITVDVAEGTTTGISAHDRGITCRTLAQAISKPTDFLKPGHICPLRAADNGVLQEFVKEFQERRANITNEDLDKFMKPHKLIWGQKERLVPVKPKEPKAPKTTKK